MNEDAVLSCIEINNKDIVVNKAPELNKDVLSGDLAKEDGGLCTTDVLGKYTPGDGIFGKDDFHVISASMSFQKRISEAEDHGNLREIFANDTTLLLQMYNEEKKKRKRRKVYRGFYPLYPLWPFPPHPPKPPKPDPAPQPPDPPDIPDTGVVDGGAVADVGGGDVGGGDAGGVAEAYENKKIQGLENISVDEIYSIVSNYFYKTINYYNFDAKIKNMAIVGSRNRNTAKDDSDLDIVIEYSGSEREDDMFNILNSEDEENGFFEINGIRVDINPIKTSLAEFLKNSARYDEYVISKLKK